MSPEALDSLFLLALLLTLAWVVAGYLLRSFARYQKRRDAIALALANARRPIIVTQADTKPEYARTQDTTSKLERPTTNYRRQHRDSR